MEIRKEVKVTDEIFVKIGENFPNMLLNGINEFEDLFGISIERDKVDPNLNQMFIGFILSEYYLFDGKLFNQFLRENLELTDDEKLFLENVNNKISGYFEVLSVEKNLVKVKDLLTKKEYEVETIDLSGVFKKDIIKAKLVKNFRDKLYFFGAMTKHNYEKDEILNIIDFYFEK